MRYSVKAAVFGALSIIFSAGTQAVMQQHEGMESINDSTSLKIIHGTGVVKGIDTGSKKITIAHEAIPDIGWPAMTMRFTFTNTEASISNLKPGSRVDFSFVQQGSISMLRNIEVKKS